MSNGALNGIKVIDMTHVYNGPFCTMHLADHGAEVIKIEPPGRGEQSRYFPPLKNGESGYYAFLNRNKKGMELNLRSEKGKEIFAKLLETADVLVENFRPGTLERLGFGWDVLKEKYPRLVYAQATGFGTYGPLAARPAYDIIAQSMGGIVSITGFPDAPPTKVGPSVADTFTGTYMALGIMMALHSRSKTGKGQRIEVSMQDAIFSTLENAIVTYTIDGKVPERVGNADPAIAPFDMYTCSDGYFFLGVGTDALWSRLCEVMNKPELVEDPRFASNNDRVNNYIPELKSIMDEWAATQTVQELESVLEEAGIPGAPILNVDDVVNHPHTAAREMIVEVEHPKLGNIKIQGVPIKLHGTPGSVRTAAPLLGEHNEEILKDLGYSDDDMKTFRDLSLIHI